MNLILSHQLDSSLLQVASTPLYYLICCYQEQYQQFIQDILSTQQTDPQLVQKLGNAFTELTMNIDLKPDLNNERVQIQKFKDNFDNFVVNVQGFLIVK